MLAFIIALKSSQVSSSWGLVCKLFERTLKSVCNQTSEDYRVIVVCHEKPEIQFESPQVTYIQVDFPIPGSTFASKDKDKMRKMQVGLLHAQKINASHVMFIDADDCISKHIAQFASQNPEENGWFFSKGYDYREDICLLRKRNKNLHLRTNTSHVVKIDLLKPEMNLSSDEIDADCGLNHPHTARVLSKRGTPLKVLPFRGVIYITDNGENIWWNQEALEPNRNSIKNSITLLIKGLYQFFITQAVTNSIREEFSLYPIN
ncbi:glycosyltransferase family A protein [Phormidium tenue]|uniref:Glycosyltransferase family 2 protein n=1 Tax=Phormidium tenue FACHB-1050 TaxID=2692857 RepID=A0ABR8CGH6_9CYAN|nr:glycosyltransferase family A protein [Phormidium tenue]MBD2319200.1 glycosyltransferase family 2 protein [Phormidium tenue FACHB-1050]